ncbi:unnamed protein product [Rotaria sp. Silwood2]|nr:unnamed protein product [Rotaria sp. Silwood2]
MNIYGIFVITTIFIAAYLTEDVAVTNREKVHAFEYAVFRLAPGNIHECKKFRHDVKPFDDEEDTVEDYLTIDCERYKNAAECYNLFYPNLDDNNPTDKAVKDEFDNIGIDYIENACANYK